jgi:hypothetical protein
LKEVDVFTLLRRYWSELVSTDGGMSLLLMDGLLLVPLVMAAFFYPIQVLIGVGAVLILTITAYECVTLWRKHHPHHDAPHAHV